MLPRSNGGYSGNGRKKKSVHWEDSEYEPLNDDERINDEAPSHVDTDMSFKTTTTRYTDIEDLGSDYYSLWTQEDYFMYYYGNDTEKEVDDNVAKTHDSEMEEKYVNVLDVNDTNTEDNDDENGEHIYRKNVIGSRRIEIKNKTRVKT